MAGQDKAGGVGRLRRLVKKARAAEERMRRRAERTQRRLAVLGSAVRDAERALADAQARAPARKAEKAGRRPPGELVTDETAAAPATEAGGIALSESVVLAGAPAGEAAEPPAPAPAPVSTAVARRRVVSPPRSPRPRTSTPRTRPPHP